MAKSEKLLLRMEPEERQAFQEAAMLAGLPLTIWIRERLRRAARVELEDAGKQAPFLIYRMEKG